jgi:hypothetical protein
LELITVVTPLKCKQSRKVKCLPGDVFNGRDLKM